MSKLNKLSLIRICSIAIIGFAMGLIYNNIAISNPITDYGFSLHNKAGADLEADSEISFMCVKDDDVFVVRMARSMARKSEGRWYLPAHGQCSYHHWQ